MPPGSAGGHVRRRPRAFRCGPPAPLVKSVRSDPPGDIRPRVRSRPAEGENDMHVQAYLFFEGRCEEALEFYRSALGAEIGPVMRFRDNPDDPGRTMFPPGAGEMIMHATMRVGETTVLLSDG